VSMAAEAALRVGAGLVSAATQPVHIAGILSRRPEVMVHGVVSGQELEPLLGRASVLVAGPGLGRTPWSEQLLQKATECDCAMVLDADALNILADGRVVSRKKADHRILTPHPGEAARLLACTVDEIQSDRFAAAEALQKTFGGVVVLKGAGTLIATNDRVFLSVEGNPGMASGGMGDLLSGIIGGLLAQGFSLIDAAKTGVVLHNACADRAASRQGERGMIATDLLQFLPAMLNPRQTLALR
ncbi:MAG: NAD(P)H-hydrate dehydratase, partial [Pseudomonadales bacterium]|nr:NAD(P)H-hydrate dehydratase [Pseudomonadales bacterium]